MEFAGKLTHEMFAFGSEIAVVPLEGRTSNDMSPVKAMAKARIVETVRQWVGVECQVRFSSDSSAVIYAPSNMISTLVGRGGENVKQLQNELGGLRFPLNRLMTCPTAWNNPTDFGMTTEGAEMPGTILGEKASRNEGNSGKNEQNQR